MTSHLRDDSYERAPEIPEGAEPLRVYSRLESAHEGHRFWITDILKACAQDERPLEERSTIYGRWIRLFRIQAGPAGADVALLPMKWNWYVDQGRVDEAVAFARDVPSDLPLLIFSGGDWTAQLPGELEDAHLIQASAYRSRALPHEVVMAPFFADTVEHELDGRVPEPSPLGERPLVGFCGQSAGSALVGVVRTLRCHRRRWAWRLGLRDWEPAPFEHVRLRARALDVLDRHPEVETHFVRRERYLGSVVGRPSEQELRREFLDSILETDYTVCVRGSGNYSLRFFEALCLGRIPLLLDTDCLLPFADTIDWSRHCVRVPWSSWGDERAITGELLRFHREHDRDELARMQRSNRQLWLDHLSREGLYETLYRRYV